MLINDFVALIQSLLSMSPPRVVFCIVQYGLAFLSLLAGYHTPPQLRFIYVLLQIVCYIGVFYYIPSRHDEGDYVWALCTYLPYVFGYICINHRK
jgi:hypothetical protein